MQEGGAEHVEDLQRQHEEVERRRQLEAEGLAGVVAHALLEDIVPGVGETHSDE